MEDIEVKRIHINEPFVNGIILENGKANWDIVPESSDAEFDTDSAATDITTKISLSLFSIKKARIYYTDHSSNLSATLDDFNFNLTGDFSKDFSTLVIDSRTERVNLHMGGVRYLKNVVLTMHFDIDANLKESIYNLQGNSVALNDLALGFSGSVEMPESGDILTNLKFETSNTDFKTLLSLVPAIYMKDFSDLQTTGKLKLEGTVSGAVTETASPTIDAKLLVSDATFAYPDLPKSAEDIQIDIDLHYDGVQMDNTTVDVNKFHLALGGNPVDLTLNLRNPITDPFTNGSLNAVIDLGSMKDVIELENTELTGIIKANLDWMGKVSSIENQQYEEFKADGQLSIASLSYNSPDLPKALKIESAVMGFSPKYVELSSFDAELGNSDFRLSGRLSNYIPFLLKEETVKGELTFNSTLIDLNEFLTSEASSDEDISETDTVPMQVIEVPGNIDFRLVSSIDKLLYDKMEMERFRGVIYVKDKRVVMEDLSLQMLDGRFAVSGEYNSQDMRSPLVDFKFKATDINIPKTFAAFELLQKIAPIAAKADGNVTLGMSFTSFLTQDMKPILKSIVSDGTLGSKRIGIKNANAFNSLGKVLNTDAFNNLTLNDLELDFEILDGKIFVDPFDITMGDVSMLIAGEQSFDNLLNYGINISAPRKLLGLENPTINNLYSNAAKQGINIEKAEMVNMLARITGPMNDPKVSIDLKDNIKNTTESIKKELKETAVEVIETKKEEAKEEVRKQAKAEADKIMQEAKKQADAIKAEAKKAADAVRWEANSNADKVMKEAGSNPIKKAVAEPAARKIREEGEKKAQQIENEAKTKADKLINDAQARADKILEM